MIEQNRFALNRAVFPRLDIAGFFELASRLGIHKVELRNDFSSGILDGCSPREVRSLANNHDIKIITINRFIEFNAAARLPELICELMEMLQLAVSIGCEAIVLVPTRSNADPRSREQIFDDTVKALKTFRSYFEGSRVEGFIETLGFADCSMRSAVEAMKAIRESGATCYKVVYDTFHHVLGPDTAESIEKEFDVDYTGLVHVSGVTSDAPPDQYTDGLRVLVGPDDKLRNIEQLARLERLGYRGNISFEPFAKEVHGLDIRGIETAIRESVKFIQSSSDQATAAPL